MNCTQCQELLGLLATGDLAGEERNAAEAHAAACPDCMAELSYCRKTVILLRAGERPAATERFAAAVRAAARAEIAAARRRALLRRVLFAGSALAASLAITFGVIHAVQGRPAPLGNSLTSTPGDPAGGNASPVAQVMLREIWQHAGAQSVPVSTATAAVVRGPNVYLLLESAGTLHVAALNAASGEQKWRSAVESVGYLAADGQHVYCLAQPGAGLTELVALDAASGAVQWRYRQEETLRPAGPTRAAVVSPGRLCWTVNATVHMLDAGDGRPLWTRAISQEGLLSEAAATGDGLLVASCGALYCLSADSGETLWREELTGQFAKTARPLLATSAGPEQTNARLGDSAGEALGERDSEQFAPSPARPVAPVAPSTPRPLAASTPRPVVFVALHQRNGQARVICFDPAARKEVWGRNTPQVFHLLADDGRLFVRDQGVLALDAAGGEPLWAWQARGCGPVSVSDGVVYFVDTTDRGRLVAVNGRTGRAAWEMAGVRSCEAFLAAPTSGTGYFKTQDGVFRAMALAHRS